uniref:Uncharacterized protein n=1 Tax=Glossina brevipalpis TaxID=37001 RepID=A0A1A9WWN4_9MUSC
MHKKKSSSRVTSFSSLLDDTIPAEPSEVKHDECSKFKRVPWREIRDYMEFKAARTAQRFVRGWLTRNRIAKLNRAAIIIQTEWKRFYYQRSYFNKLECILQQQIEEHYFRAAQKIQALFRGWWSREYIHDHMYLTRLENSAGQDLLHCVAFKLHHLIRTHVIPGIYSLKNTTTLSKVEKLLASIAFKRCTDREWYRQNALRVLESKARNKNSVFATLLPFRGPNVYQLCAPECLRIYNERDADRKMAKILRMYELASHIHPKVAKIRAKKCKPANNTYMAPDTTFCDDIVRCMRKFKILRKKKLALDKDIFDDPKTLENFLTEVESKWSNFRVRSESKDASLERLEKLKTNKEHCPRT